MWFWNVVGTEFFSTDAINIISNVGCQETKNLSATNFWKRNHQSEKKTNQLYEFIVFSLKISADSEMAFEKAQKIINISTKNFQLVVFCKPFLLK